MYCRVWTKGGWKVDELEAGWVAVEVGLWLLEVEGCVDEAFGRLSRESMVVMEA
jgi:hypothetical protein